MTGVKTMVRSSELSKEQKEWMKTSVINYIPSNKKLGSKIETHDVCST
jgi:hypothetical protein